MARTYALITKAIQKLNFSRDYAMTWPKHFPAGCPQPKNTVPTNGIIYRLVSSDPPRPEDVLSCLQKGQFKHYPECIRAGLSCYLNIQATLNTKAAVPRLRDHLLAKATLNPSHGRMAQTTNNPHHHTIWLKKKYLDQFTTIFVVMK